MTHNPTNRYCKAGERIITRGKPAVECYLILNGRIEVSLQNEDGRKITIGELQSGSIFGEAALIGVGFYGANVDALTDTELAVITPASFAGTLANCDPLLRAILEMLIDRLRKTNEALLRSETREFMDIDFV